MTHEVMTTKNHGSASLPWFTLLLALLSLGCFQAFGPANESLVWSRAGMSDGEVWRVLSGHIVHVDFEHLLWNVGALAIIGGLLENRFNRRPLEMSGLAVLSGVVVALAVNWLRPDLVLYAGLSGVLNAFFVVLLWHIWRRFRHPTTILVAIGAFLKISYEVIYGASLVGAGAWPPVPEAHAAGVLAGGLAIFVLRRQK